MTFYDYFQAPDKYKYKSLTRPPRFSGPYVTSVGGTTKFLPEAAANLSGGGFSWYFDTPEYQRRAVAKYLNRYPDRYDGLFKCARCQAHFRDLAFSYLFVQP